MSGNKQDRGPSEEKALYVVQGVDEKDGDSATNVRARGQCQQKTLRVEEQAERGEDQTVQKLG